MNIHEVKVTERVIEITIRELSEAFAGYQVDEYWKTEYGHIDNQYFNLRLDIIRSQDDYDIIYNIFKEIPISCLFPGIISDKETDEHLYIRFVITKTDGTTFEVSQDNIRMK